MANGGFFGPAPQNFEGLLGDPAFNMGMGLLGAGLSRPRNVGEALLKGVSAGGGLIEQTRRNDLLRERLRHEAAHREGEQRRRQAIERLQGLLNPGDVDPAEQAPGAGPSQAEMIGLLGEIAPQQLAQGLLGQMFGQERAEPSDVRTIRAMGLDPTTGKGREMLEQKFLAGGGSAEQLDMLLKGLQIDKLQTERAEARTDKERKRIDAKLSIFGGLDTLDELAQINQRLRGTLAESGIGFDDLRRIAAGPVSMAAELFGGDPRRARQLAADFQRFDQLTTSAALETLFSGEVSAGTITDSKLGVILKTKPGVNQLPETNARILADMMQAKLDAAARLGVEIPDIEGRRARIEALRQAEAAEAEADAPPAGRQEASGRGPSPGEIGRMDAQGLSALDLDSLTTAQRRALDRRLKELGF